MKANTLLAAATAVAFVAGLAGVARGRVVQSTGEGGQVQAQPQAKGAVSAQADTMPRTIDLRKTVNNTALRVSFKSATALCGKTIAITMEGTDSQPLHVAFTIRADAVKWHVVQDKISGTRLEADASQAIEGQTPDTGLYKTVVPNEAARECAGPLARTPALSFQ